MAYLEKIDLTSTLLVAALDEGFAPRSLKLKDELAVWIASNYDDRAKSMKGRAA